MVWKKGLSWLNRLLEDKDKSALIRTIYFSATQAILVLPVPYTRTDTVVSKRRTWLICVILKKTSSFWKRYVRFLNLTTIGMFTVFLWHGSSWEPSCSENQVPLLLFHLSYRISICAHKNWNGLMLVCLRCCFLLLDLLSQVLIFAPFFVQWLCFVFMIQCDQVIMLTPEFLLHFLL